MCVRARVCVRAMAVEWGTGTGGGRRGERKSRIRKTRACSQHHFGKSGEVSPSWRYFNAVVC